MDDNYNEIDPIAFLSIEDIEKSLIKYCDIPDIIFNSNDKIRKYFSKTISRAHEELIGWDVYLTLWFIKKYKGIFPNEEKNYPSLKNNLVKWLLEQNIVKKNNCAKKVYSIIWKIISNKYKLDETFNDHIEKIHEYESITGTIKTNTASKKYRDHLSHNIRAALLNAYLCEKIENNDEPLNKKRRIGFLSGLFHDISHPIVDKSKLFKQLASVFKNLPYSITATESSEILFERQNRQELFLFIIMISSIEDGNKEDIINAMDWFNIKNNLEKINRVRLLECALNGIYENHATLSAVILLDQFIKGHHKDNLNQVMEIIDIEDNNEFDTYLEFFSILQSIALHDRKSIIDFDAKVQRYQYLPENLNLKEHYFPGLCILADELQEWGRPIGNMKTSLIKDCYIKCNNDKVDAEKNLEIVTEYEFNINKEAINDVPYNLFEHILGKTYNLCGMKDNKEKNIDYKFILTFKSDLILRYINVSHDKTFDVKKINISPKRTNKDAHLNFESNNNDFFYLDYKYDDDEWKYRDILIIKKGSGEELYKKPLKDKKIEKIVIILKCDEKKSELKIYIFGRKKPFVFELIYNFLGKMQQSAQLNFKKIDHENNLSVVYCETPEKYCDEDNSNLSNVKYLLQELPESHLFNYEWRFSSESIEKIYNFILEYADGDNKKIALAGIYTVALYLLENYAKVRGEIYIFISQPISNKISKMIKKKIKLLKEEDRIKFTLVEVSEKTKFDDFHDLFDFIIADPPWYCYEYLDFCKTYIRCVKENSIFGITQYVPLSEGYKEDKKDKLEKIFNLITDDKNKVIGSLEVDYDRPSFELGAGISKIFYHTDSNKFRPTYLDFFVIDDNNKIPEQLIKLKKMKKIKYVKLLKEFKYLEDYNIEDRGCYYYHSDENNDVSKQAGYYLLIRYSCTSRPTEDKKKDIINAIKHEYQMIEDLNIFLETIENRFDNILYGWSTANSMIFKLEENDVSKLIVNKKDYNNSFVYKIGAKNKEQIDKEICDHNRKLSDWLIYFESSIYIDPTAIEKKWHEPKKAKNCILLVNVQ